MQSSTQLLTGIIFVATMLPSCMGFVRMKQPLTESAPKLKQGSTVRITFNNGVVVNKIIVKQVWADSILVGNDSRALKLSDIGKIEVRKVDPVLTAMAVIPTLAIVIIYLSNRLYN